MLDCHTVFLGSLQTSPSLASSQVPCTEDSYSREGTRGLHVALDVNCHPPCLLSAPALDLAPKEGWGSAGAYCSGTWASSQGATGAVATVSLSCLLPSCGQCVPTRELSCSHPGGVVSGRVNDCSGEVEMVPKSAGRPALRTQAVPTCACRSPSAASTAPSGHR